MTFSEIPVGTKFVDDTQLEIYESTVYDCLVKVSDYCYSFVGDSSTIEFTYEHLLGDSSVYPVIEWEE